MSTTPLSNIQELIERSLFEIIRLELVDKGYLPDVTSFANTALGNEAYNTALSGIVSSKGFAIELFNEGSNLAKGVKKVPRIVINTGNFLPGALGGDPSVFFSDQGAYYQALVTPPQTVDFYLNIHLVSENAKQERILNAILALAIPRRGYLSWYTNPLELFFCRNISFFQYDDPSTGMIEKVYAYEIPDCWDREDSVVHAEVAKMTEIGIHPTLKKYMDGDWGSMDVSSILALYNCRGSTNVGMLVTGTLGS